MDFKQAEERFEGLKSRFAQGTLSETDFKAQLEELMIQDEQGDWWMIGYETGQWYRNDGNDWVRAEPPGHTSKLSGQRAEEERLAQAKTEKGAVVTKKEEIDQQVTPVQIRQSSISTSIKSKKSVSKMVMYGVTVIVLIFGGIGFGIFSALGGQTLPSTPTKVANTAVKTNTVVPNKVPNTTKTSAPRPTSTMRPSVSPTSLTTEIEIVDFTLDGSWTKLENCPGNKNPCWADNPSGRYLNSVYYRMTSPKILVAATWGNPYLIYWQKYNTEGEYDFLQFGINDLSVRRNSGTRDWHQIAVNLEAFQGRNIVINFLISTDSSVVGEGWYLRDIKIVPNATSAQLQSTIIVEP